MKVKLLSTLILFTSQFSFSQTIKGKVVFNNYAVPKVEVINANSKIITVSDPNGEFSIVAKTNDVLVFISKEHQLKKLTTNPKLFTNGELIIDLLLKAEELNEVVITNIPSIHLCSDANYEQKKLDEYALEKATSSIKVIGVNTGTIENEANFMRIGGMLFGLLAKEKEPQKKEVPKIKFKDLVNTTCDQNYFLETLKLKPDEIELFLQFCEADPKSKTIAETNNALSVMDFLFTKNIEFKKL
ncbi:hypothetical protein [Flavobacterium sp. WC2429]|uniref:Carboxypeptidase-like regulatory domain-containing protein n=2 Tax=unclassified Flavobacterium TaxID=196869 RepID=A0AB39WCS3_9FLAO